MEVINHGRVSVAVFLYDQFKKACLGIGGFEDNTVKDFPFIFHYLLYFNFIPGIDQVGMIDMVFIHLLALMVDDGSHPFSPEAIDLYTIRRDR